MEHVAGVKWNHKEQNTLQAQHVKFMFYSGAWSIHGTLKQTFLGAVGVGSREKPRKRRVLVELS